MKEAVKVLVELEVERRRDEAGVEWYASSPQILIRSDLDELNEFKGMRPLWFIGTTRKNVIDTVKGYLREKGFSGTIRITEEIDF